MNVKQAVSFLKNTYLFREVAEKKMVMTAKYVRENIFDRGEIISNEGERGDSLHIIASGAVKITKYTKNGKTKTLAILRGKEVLAKCLF